MNMFSTAMASEKDRDDKRYQYDDDYNRYQQSNYQQDRYSNHYDNSYDNQKMYTNNYDKAPMTNKDMIIVMIKHHTQ